MTINEKYLDFVREYGKEPSYAEATVKFLDNNEIVSGMIFKLSCDYEEEEDDLIFFYCNDYTSLESFTEPGLEDFIILPESIEFIDSI